MYSWFFECLRIQKKLIFGSTTGKLRAYVLLGENSTYRWAVAIICGIVTVDLNECPIVWVAINADPPLGTDRVFEAPVIERYSRHFKFICN